MMYNFVEKHGDYFYFVFRVLVGLMFMQHGVQKLFGWLTERPPAEVFSLFGLAGILEVFGGLLIVIGLFTRLTASITALEMLVAYFKAHAPQGYIPILNGGELALMFFASFLVLIVYGAGKWSIEKAILKKEIF
jgi:putative oxidoreductase